MTTLPELTPDSLDFVLLSFEGPDEYSLAGGLGVRMRELSLELANQGFRTHLVFMGAPEKPAEESPMPGLTLHRWARWLSAHFEAGVYDGEEAKLVDWNKGVPEFVVSRLIAPAVREGRSVAVLAEEWHTAYSTCEISDRLWSEGIRDKALILWNSNNVMGFDRIDWARLSYCSTLTTVSRYMKHVMWGYGVNPIVIPNGIPSDEIKDADPSMVKAVRDSFAGKELVLKLGRFSPDKRWLMAVDALAEEKRRGHYIAAIFRGGLEPHGAEVLARARDLGLKVRDVEFPRDPGQAVALLGELPEADIYNVTTFMAAPFVSLIYSAADAVLANSGHEPFGLVGLEVMAAGGVAFLGATGEDYAVSFFNSIVLDTDDPFEINVALDVLRTHPDIARRLRVEARETAGSFTWRNVVSDNLLNRLRYVALGQTVLSPPQQSPARSASPNETLVPGDRTAPEAGLLPRSTGMTAASLAYGGRHVGGRLAVQPRVPMR